MLLGRSLNDGDLVAGEFILGKKLTEFQFDEFDKLGVIHHVYLVEVDHDIGDTDLACQEDMLSRLGHRTVIGADDKDCSVHLGSAGDHVLDVVGMTGAVHMGIVTVVRLIFHVSGGDGDTALLLLRGLVDLVEGDPLRLTLIGKTAGNGRGQVVFP